VAMNGFESAVLHWLQANGHPDAQRVSTVEGSGTDWYGDTENGWSARFTVTIKWHDDADAPHFDEIEGEEMASLWNAVVAAVTA